MRRLGGLPPRSENGGARADGHMDFMARHRTPKQQTVAAKPKPISCQKARVDAPSFSSMASWLRRLVSPVRVGAPFDAVESRLSVAGAVTSSVAHTGTDVAVSEAVAVYSAVVNKG